MVNNGSEGSPQIHNVHTHLQDVMSLNAQSDEGRIFFSDDDAINLILE